MGRADLPLTNGVGADADVDRLRNRVYLDSCLSSTRDRDVAGRAE
jgi:hypothetical protein